MAEETTDLHAQLAQHLADLSKKHASISYVVLGVLGLVLVLGTVAGYFALKQYDAQLARAEAREELYDQDRKAWAVELKARDAERAADAQRVEELIEQIAARAAKPLPPVIQAGLAPKALPSEVKDALQASYADRADFGSLSTDQAGNVVLSQPQAQIVLLGAVDLKRLKLDFADAVKVIDLQKGTISSLTKDLDTEKALNVEANKSIEDFKKLTKKSRWKKFMGGAEKVALVVGGIWLGTKI